MFLIMNVIFPFSPLLGHGFQGRTGIKKAGFIITGFHSLIYNTFYGRCRA
jgi:hypothetical protein